jgi:hypothetical protein
MLTPKIRTVQPPEPKTHKSTVLTPQIRTAQPPKTPKFRPKTVAATKHQTKMKKEKATMTILTPQNYHIWIKEIQAYAEQYQV